MRTVVARALAAAVAVAVSVEVAACGDDDAPEAAAVTATESASVQSPGPSASATRPAPSPTATGTTLATATTGTASSSSPAPGSPTASGTRQPQPSAQPTSEAATPTPTTAPPTTQPAPQPQGEVSGVVTSISAIHLESAGLDSRWPIEPGDTVFSGGTEYFADPSAPQYIMWYPRFSRTGHPAGNTMMAAHVNYVGFGNGPFAYLLDTAPGDALYLTLGGGEVLAYTVKSVTLYTLAEIDMNTIVYPDLDVQTERVTLMSCGGTFIPAASGYGGEYDSRVVLVAERYVQ